MACCGHIDFMPDGYDKLRKRRKVHCIVAGLCYGHTLYNGREVLQKASRVNTRRGVSHPKMDLVCEPDVSGNKKDIEPPVFPWTCCESL